MEFENLAQVATIAGSAFISAGLMQLFVKAALQARYPENADSERSKQYGIVMNAVAGILAIAASLVIGIIVNGVSAESIAWSFVTGIGGGLVAISGYEVTSNIGKLFAANK
jgi:hypothetical protein